MNAAVARPQGIIRTIIREEEIGQPLVAARGQAKHSAGIEATIIAGRASREPAMTNPADACDKSTRRTNHTKQVVRLRQKNRLSSA